VIGIVDRVTPPAGSTDLEWQFFSRVVAGVRGVVPACEELSPVLVRHGDELRRDGGALEEFEPALLMREKNL